MINTVLGEISKEELGRVRIHEHVLWAWTGEARSRVDRDIVVSTMLPHLKELKSMGCDSIVEATTEGAGRDVDVLRELSEESGLNIITNCGVWDGLDLGGIYVPPSIREMSPEEIAGLWIDEFKNGIDGTGIRPGVIKIGLGDNDNISAFQSRFLEAAIITSRSTDLPILSHICSSRSARTIVEKVREKGLHPDRFIWSHADYIFDRETIIDMAGLGVWIELSWNTCKVEDLSWYIETIDEMKGLNLLGRLLISQDAGGYHNGEIVSYRHFYTKFIRGCSENGITEAVLDEILITNPANVLDRSTISKLVSH